MAVVEEQARGARSVSRLGTAVHAFERRNQMVLEVQPRTPDTRVRDIGDEVVLDLVFRRTGPYPIFNQIR